MENVAFTSYREPGAVIVTARFRAADDLLLLLPLLLLLLLLLLPAEESGEK